MHVAEKQKPQKDTYHHLERPEAMKEIRKEPEQYSALVVEQDEQKYSFLQHGPTGTSASSEPRFKKLKQGVW